MEDMSISCPIKHKQYCTSEKPVRNPPFSELVGRDSCSHCCPPVRPAGMTGTDRFLLTLMTIAKPGRNDGKEVGGRDDEV